MRPAFGVLALQGDFAAHEAALRRAGVAAGELRRVRRVGELAGVKGLVLPGGESTTVLKLMAEENNPIFICRGLKVPLRTLWPRLKKWN